MSGSKILILAGILVLMAAGISAVTADATNLVYQTQNTCNIAAGCVECVCNVVSGCGCR